MMSQVLDFDVRDAVVSDGTFGPREIQKILNAVSNDPTRLAVLRDAVAELESRDDHTPASLVRLGVCQYVLGHYETAVQTLSRADGGALAHYYLAQARASLQQYDEAIASFEAARKAGYDPGTCSLGISEVQRTQGDPEAALRTLDELSGAVEQTAGYLYQRAATVAALGGKPEEVVALYERAVDADNETLRSSFRTGRRERSTWQR